MTTAQHTGRWDADVSLPEPRANRPVTNVHKIEAFITKRLFGLFSAFPIEKASHGMGQVLRHAGPFLGPVHRRGKQNLKLIYPDMTPAERSAILRDCWYNLGATAAEYSHLEELADRTEIRNVEALDAMIRKNEQAIFVSGHFANWEAMAIALYARGLKYAVVYRPANNPLVDAEIIERRAEVLSRRQIPKSKRGARDLVKALSDGLSLCMLTDQKLNDGIEAPLLGHPAMTTPAAARLALKEGMPVIPLQIVRKPGARFVMTVHEPIDFEATGEMKEDTPALTAAINAKIGEFIMERPDQWLWFHRRWPRELTA